MLDVCPAHLLGAELDGPGQGEPGTVRPLQEIAVGCLVGLGRWRPLVVAVLAAARIWPLRARATRYTP